ncbi:transcriptional regulator CynR [Xenorhabdus sp. Sc-CR9]|nr:transcriptional regulator CynR [Xenorhabdus sp. Sc-CR9]
MNLRHIWYFLAVAEQQSFTRAADVLHISQPALSQQIKILEKNLGIQLFDRTGRNTRLTDTGEVYVQYVRRAFQCLEEGKRAIHDVEDLSRGTLRIAVTPTFTNYFIGPLFADFYSRYPDITLQLQEISQEKIERMLLNDDIDIGIAFEESYSPDITTIKLMTETLAVVVADQHSLAHQASITFNELHHEKLILLSPEFATRVQIDHLFCQRDIKPKVQMEMSSISAILEVIRRTSLVTLLPVDIPRRDNGLVTIPLVADEPRRTAVLMQRHGAWQTAAARAFIAMAQVFSAKIQL